MNKETVFPISEKMKKVREIQLDLLYRFSRICEENGLRYFLDGGTLLGAVRHGGFIPWDDDVDVIMPREDYDRLCEIADKVFEYPYFFQTSMTEECFFRAHAQLRNSETTGFIPEDEDKSINKGIFIDIFILDGIADSTVGRILQRLQNAFFRKVLSYSSDRKLSELSRGKRLIYRLIHGSYRFIPFKKQFSYYNHKILAKYSFRETRLLGDLTLGWRENVQWPREWYSDYVMMAFERLQLRIPYKYAEILEKQYGDYMKIPDDINESNGKMHSAIVFEPNIPYKDYFRTI